MFLHNNARAPRRLCQLFVDAVDLLSVVHCVDEDLAPEQIVRKGAQPYMGSAKMMSSA